MAQDLDLPELIARGFVFEIDRLPDAPPARDDKVLYENRRTGRRLIARAPIPSELPALS